MNIFYLDESPAVAARYHCDKHVVKMIVETAQLLSSAHWLHPDNPSVLPKIYRLTHKNHPCAIWVRSSSLHYVWTFRLLEHLLHEYTYRYEKTHATTRLLEPLSELPLIPDDGFVQPPQAMPDEYKHVDAVEAYRKYYVFGKTYLLRYTNRNQPEFIKELQNVHS